MCVCVRVCLRACVSYRWPNGWTDHDHIWHAYVDISGNGSNLKMLTQRMARKGGLIGANIQKGYLGGVAKSYELRKLDH